MYGAYERTHSVFQNSNMMAEGKPGADELALLEPFRGKVPDEVFGEPFVPPVSDGSGQDRALLRQASAAAARGGLPDQGRQACDAKGEPITIEFLIDEPTFQPHHMPFIKNLAVLGIDATLRVVDPVQYRKRVDDFDFDITVQRFSFSSTPGDSLRSYLHLAGGRASKGSQNLAGIADPVIDALIEQDHRGRDAAGAGHRLPRARPRHPRRPLLGSALVQASHRIAYWDVFGWPEKKPRFRARHPGDLVV